MPTGTANEMALQSWYLNNARLLLSLDPVLYRFARTEELFQAEPRGVDWCWAGVNAQVIQDAAEQSAKERCNLGDRLDNDGNH